MDYYEQLYTQAYQDKVASLLGEAQTKQANWFTDLLGRMNGKIVANPYKSMGAAGAGSGLIGYGAAAGIHGGSMSPEEHEQILAKAVEKAKVEGKQIGLTQQNGTPTEYLGNSVLGGGTAALADLIAGGKGAENLGTSAALGALVSLIGTAGVDHLYKPGTPDAMSADMLSKILSTVGGGAAGYAYNRLRKNQPTLDDTFNKV